MRVSKCCVEGAYAGVDGDVAALECVARSCEGKAKIVLRASHEEEPLLGGSALEGELERQDCAADSKDAEACRATLGNA